MAGPTNVLVDHSLLSKLDTRLYLIERVLAYISGIGIFSLMLFAVISVGGRNLFHSPLPGYVDWIEQAMMVIAFLGVSYVQRDGSHIRMDAVISLFSGRALWFLEFVTTLSTLFIIIVLIYGSYQHFLRSFDFNAPLWSRDSTMDIGLPLWPSKLIVPVSFSVLAIRLVLQLYGFARALIYNLERPIAVPLIKNSAQQAAEEAGQVE